MLNEEKLAKTLEAKSSNTFFDKKKIIIFSVGLVLTIALLAVTFKFVLDIDYAHLFESLSGGLRDRVWIVFVVLALGSCKLFLTNVSVVIRLQKLGYKVALWEYILFSFSYTFIQSVTPANFVSDPYIMFWIKTKKASNAEAYAITTTNTLVWQLVQLLITLPSFAMVAPLYDCFEGFKGQLIYWLMICGALLDILGSALFIVLCFSKRISYWLSVAFNWCKKMLRIQYHTKEQSRQSYLIEGRASRLAKNTLFQWKDTIIITLLIASVIVAQYSLFYFATLWITPKDFTVLDFTDVFNCANVALTANKMIPLPGSTLSLELSLQEMLKAIHKSQGTGESGIEQIASDAVLTFRTFYTYIPAIIGIFTFSGLTFIQYRIFKYKNKTLKKIHLTVDGSKETITAFIEK